MEKTKKCREIKMAEYNRYGKYSVTNCLGKGGNGEVFISRNTGEEVAIKVLKGNERNRNFKKKINRFVIETKTVVRIQDDMKGIIPILDYRLPDKKNGKYWYAMPVAETVKEHLKEGKIFDKVMCVLELARTLKILHEKEIVHRDIKPDNIYYYKGHYCLGDFGLVDYPEKKDLTLSREPVGPKSTMAPEMRYNVKNADGKKADVYSLAKTLWILLTGNLYGFEGRYEEDDAIIGLRRIYRKEHMVELELLLKKSTEYDPALRPSMGEFIENLELWIETVTDIKKSNYSEWKYLQNRLFPKTVPLRTEWRDLDSIINILNEIGSMPGLNHMFLPTGGGLDIESAEHANEEGCICLKAGGINYILKPQKLELENYEKDDYIWSYFRLQLENIDAIFNATNEKEYELLIEDFPGHYVESKLACYGRYNDGSEFPKDYREVERVLSGSFVIFSKQSVYNYISGTYDARHNQMNSVEFRCYIGNMRMDYHSSRDYSQFFSIYNKNPFKMNEKNSDEKFDNEIAESCKFDKFIEENWNKWNLKDICDRNNKNKVSKLGFILIFHVDGGEFGSRKYVSETGHICEENSIPYLIDEKGKYIFTNFDGAVRAVNEIEEYIQSCCSESGVVWQKIGLHFSIELFRREAPSALFTEDEIRNILKAGDDSRNNQLVVDENGHVHLIDGDLPYEWYKYPVVHEVYNKRNNYVGLYASLNHVGETYQAMLDGWLQHLSTGQRCYIDYYDESVQEIDEILKEINKYY